MDTKKRILEGDLNKLPDNQIYINVNHLQEGTYVLKIIHQNKVILKTVFKKER